MARKEIGSSGALAMLGWAVVAMVVTGCGSGSGDGAPQEVLATRGCQEGNPFGCHVVAVEKATNLYKDGMTGRESEAWCLVFRVGDGPPKTSIAYWAHTTEGEQWLPAVGGKQAFERLGCVKAAEQAP